jgi:hypothetical protein
MRRLGLLLLCVFALRGEAAAVLLAHDNVPAATLLLPYFETAPDDPNGASTVFTIGNADRDPHLAHVTLWTDLGVPTFAFDVYLPGHDVVEIDLRLVFAGILPQTSPSKNVQGTHAAEPVAFPGCAALGTQGRLDAAQRTALRNAHTGLASDFWGGMCGARPVGDGIARGYVTVDVVNRCSTKFPGDPASGGDPAYFANGGTGIASNENALWGEFWFNDRTQGVAYGDALVHIEAGDPPFPDDFTFYGRLVDGTAVDNREPLYQTYYGRYQNGGGLIDVTYALVWRDPGVRTPFTCGSSLPRMQQRSVTPFDEEEHPVDLREGLPIGFQTRVPWAAERIDTSDAARLPIPFTSGFLFLDLAFPASVSDPLFGGRNQAFVVMVHQANGRFAGAQRAWPSQLYHGVYPVP